MLGDLSFTNIVIWLIAILVSLSIHEAMHAYAGYALGDETARLEGRLSLNPLRHIDPFMTVLLPLITLVTFGVPILAAKPVPFNPMRVRFDEFGAALIAAAGPFSNLLLAIIAAIFTKTFVAGTLISDFFTAFVGLNVALFVFNLIPIPPLDGSRVLYAFAPEPVQRFMQQIEPYGLFVIFALVLFGGLSPLLIQLNETVLRLLP